GQAEAHVTGELLTQGRVLQVLYDRVPPEPQHADGPGCPVANAPLTGTGACHAVHDDARVGEGLGAVQRLLVPVAADGRPEGDAVELELDDVVVFDVERLRGPDRPGACRGRQRERADHFDGLQQIGACGALRHRGGAAYSRRR